MPLYEHQCPNGHVETKLMSIEKAARVRANEWPPVTCETCGKMMKQVMSVASIPPSTVQR